MDTKRLCELAGIDTNSPTVKKLLTEANDGRVKLDQTNKAAELCATSFKGVKGGTTDADTIMRLVKNNLSALQKKFPMLDESDLVERNFAEMVAKKAGEAGVSNNEQGEASAGKSDGNKDKWLTWLTQAYTQYKNIPTNVGRDKLRNQVIEAAKKSNVDLKKFGGAADWVFND